MIINDWYNLYFETWANKITKKSFKHPAKFAPGLIRNIYSHLIMDGFIKPGDTIIDPFGGVALGALNAQISGINWVGIELEQRFVEMGNDNLDLWRKRYAGKLPLWGNAILLQGDSRNLLKLLSNTLITPNATISSPPFIDNTPHNGGKAEFIDQKHIHGDYGSSEGQLGKMADGDFSAVVSSPPFMETSGGSNVTSTKGVLADPNMIDRHRGGNRAGKGYGESTGQLGGMKEGNFDAAVSSPPYADGCTHEGGNDPDPSHIRGGEINTPGISGIVSSPPYAEARIGQESGQEQCGHNNAYSTTTGQLGAMKPGELDAAVSSPPFEKQNSGGGIAASLQQRSDYPLTNGGLKRTKKAKNSSDSLGYTNQSDNPENMANKGGDTFWIAARQIVEQTYTILKPGAVAVWVLKAYVKNKKRVDFPGQWQQLCEAVGFETIHIHRAWVVEDRGAQFHMDGALIEKKAERKSFFRRLAETKGAPRIDYEIVLCMRKPAE